MKPHIKKDPYTGRWQCVSQVVFGMWCSILVGYGNDARKAYDDWARQ